MIKYSIIIPHYNAPQLLARCLGSIPVSEEIQVVVVDDCSPNAENLLDRVPELKRPYLEFYSTGINGGGGKARNVGLQHAKGKWVLFADCDDYFVDGFVDILGQYTNTSDDIVFFNVQCYDEAGNKVRGIKEKLYEIYEQRGDERIFRYCYTEPWGKLYRRSLITDNNIKFEEVVVANDFLFSVKTGFYAHEVLISKKYLYNYTVMTSSTSRGKMSKEKKKARLVEKIKVQKFLETHGVKTNYNLLSYVPRFKAFFPIITTIEINTFKERNYPWWPVVKDRLKLMFHKIINKKFDLSPNTRYFI